MQTVSAEPAMRLAASAGHPLASAVRKAVEQRPCWVLRVAQQVSPSHQAVLPESVSVLRRAEKALDCWMSFA